MVVSKYHHHHQWAGNDKSRNRNDRWISKVEWINYAGRGRGRRRRAENTLAKGYAINQSAIINWRRMGPHKEPTPPLVVELVLSKIYKKTDSHWDGSWPMPMRSPRPHSYEWGGPIMMNWIVGRGYPICGHSCFGNEQQQRKVYLLSTEQQKWSQCHVGVVNSARWKGDQYGGKWFNIER